MSPLHLKEDGDFNLIPHTLGRVLECSVCPGKNLSDVSD